MKVATAQEMQRMLLAAFAQMQEKAGEEGFDGTLTRAEIAEALGISRYFAAQLMRYMISKGLAVPVKTPRLNLWLEKRSLPGIRLVEEQNGTES